MLMSKEEIIERLRDILLFADEENKEAIMKANGETKLVAELGLSSVKMLYTVIAIEETFKIRFENVGFNDFQTINDIVNYIEEKMQ